MAPEKMKEADDRRSLRMEAELLKMKERRTAYRDVFGSAMCEIASKAGRVAAVSAANPEENGLQHFRDMYPDRFFDIESSEAHAVAFAAGMALSGSIPVVAVSSSFLQRAYDQVIREVCLRNLHVVFAIDKAGIAGEDAGMHQGIFDLSYLSVIPGMTVMAPGNRWELAAMLSYAVNEHKGPAALRYPDGEACEEFGEMCSPVRFGKSEILYDEKDIALIAAGSMVETAAAVRRRLRDAGYSCSLINARFVKPLDEQMLLTASKEHRLIVTLEENVRAGGFGEHVLAYLHDIGSDARVINIALPDAFTGQGSADILRCEALIDEDSVLERVIAEYTGMLEECI